jgi:hypothetical protein
MIGQPHSMLRRLAPRARLAAIAAAVVVALNIVASALTPTSHQPHPRSRNPARLVPSATSTDGVQRQPSPVSAADLAAARETAERFLAGYLPFAYGRASAQSVRALTPAVRRQLIHEHAQLTPVERRRHPRVVSLEAAGQATGVVLATALVEDGGITTYPLRLTVQRVAGAWVVSGVDGR